MRFRAIASPWPCSSAATPGNAPGVSTKVRTGAGELFGELHDTERLAISLRIGHAEITADALVVVTALLLTDHRHRNAVELGKTGNHGGILAGEPVSVEFGEIGEHHGNIVQRIGTMGVTGDLYTLPTGEFPVYIAAETGFLFLQTADFGMRVFRVPFRPFLHLANLLTQLTQRLFKVKQVSIRQFQSSHENID